MCCVGVTAATSSASGALRPGRHMEEGMTRPRRCRQETDNTTHTPSMPTTPDIAGRFHGRLDVLLTHDWPGVPTGKGTWSGTSTTTGGERVSVQLVEVDVGLLIVAEGHFARVASWHRG